MVAAVARAFRRDRSWPISSHAPIATTSSPDTTGAIRLNASGGSTPRKPMTIAARTRIPSVCETVTLSPSATAWIGVPRVPTR